MVKTADAVVIGGGCMGASTAFHLAQRGVKKVVLVEKKYLASGSTGKSSAIVRQDYNIEELVTMSRQAYEIFSHFSEVVGGDAGFVKTGWVRLVTKADREAVQANAAMQRRLGVKVALLSPRELKKRQPQINTQDMGEAAYFPDAGYANPVATTNAFAQRARELGADIYEETEVTGIKVVGGRVLTVVTSRGEISTPVVVNTAGPWGQRIGRMVGIELPITPTRQQVGIFRRPYDFPLIHPVFYDCVTACYFRAEGEKLTHLGSDSSVFDKDEADPDHYNEDADPETVNMYLEKMRWRFPVMKRASFRGGYSGIYDTTPDRQPFIGQVSGLEGFYCLLGWSGHGFKHSPVVGELLARLVTEGETPAELGIFRVNRLEEGKPIQPRHGYATGAGAHIRF